MGQCGMTPYLHNFEECLAFSHTGSDMAFWEDIYRKAFPAMEAMHDHRENGFHQKDGIDRSILLPGAKLIYIDEKLRGRNPKTGQIYQDIALEEWSDEARHKPGWVTKPIRADYIAYAIAPLGKCYLLPVPQLQKAWLDNRTSWKAQYYEIRAQNNGYVTVSYGIPVPVLFKAIGQCLRIAFNAFECSESESN
jgi:hypothetical protein